MSYKLWDVLNELHSDTYEWVDLTHPLDNSSPYWAGIPDGSVELCKTCFDWGNEMLDCLIQTFKFPGQFGTHIDFPGHFIKNAPLSEKFGVRDMIFPLCVIDITDKVKKAFSGYERTNIGKYNDLFGDPIYMTVKTLKVTVKFKDGKVQKFEFPEDAPMVIKEK